MQYFAKMRIKLAYKIFASLLLMSIAVIGLTIGLIHNLTYRIFSEHAAQRRLGEMASLGDALEAHFRETGSFAAFDDKEWRAFAIANDRGPPPGPRKRPLPPPGMRRPRCVPSSTLRSQSTSVAENPCIRDTTIGYTRDHA